MNTNKIIAREFLLLVGCILISIMSYFVGTYLYNGFIHQRITDLSNKRIALNDEIEALNETTNAKLNNQDWFYDNFIDVYNITKPDKTLKPRLWKEFASSQNTDSIIYNWDHVWNDKVKQIMKRRGIESGQEFALFIKNNSLNSEDSKIKSKVKSIREEVLKHKRSIQGLNRQILNLDSESQTEFAKGFFIILLIIVFLIRYLFYAVRWSIITLKSKV